jgi:hypothetical protein
VVYRKQNTITPIEWKIIPSMEYFSDGWVILESFRLHFKIPLNPPFPKGDDNRSSPLAKGS